MKISIIGAGKAAHFIAQRFLENNHQIVEVYNRSEDKGKVFAATYNATFVSEINQLSSDIDALFIVVKDDAIVAVSNEIKDKNIFQIHCSGSLALNALNTEYAAVIWPIYSINASQLRSDIPLMIEAKALNLNKAKEIAQVISPIIEIVQLEQRAILHLTAVITNNFINHLLAISKDILDKEHISFDVLKPIIEQTVQSSMNNDPQNMQTGPAIRNDQQTMEQHLQLLKDLPNVKELYTAISRSIQQFHHIK